MFNCYERLSIYNIDEVVYIGKFNVGIILL